MPGQFQKKVRLSKQQHTEFDNPAFQDSRDNDFDDDDDPFYREHGDYSDDGYAHSIDNECGSSGSLSDFDSKQSDDEEEFYTRGRQPFREPFREQGEEIEGNKTYDIFGEGRDEKLSVESYYGQRLYIIFKVVFCGLLFLAGTGSAVLSKTTLALIVANINPPSPRQNNSLKTLNFNLVYPSQGTYIIWIWALFIIVITPYITSLLVNIWRIAKSGTGINTREKKHAKTSKETTNKSDQSKTTSYNTSSWKWKYMFVILLLEAASCVGLNILLFTILPTLDPITGILLGLNVTAFPALIGIFLTDGHTSRSRGRVMNILGLIFAAGCSFLWVYHIMQHTAQSNNTMVFLILMTTSPILISAGWWKSALYKRKQKSPNTGTIGDIRIFIRGHSNLIEVILNIFNILITCLYVLFVFDFQCGDGIYCTKLLFKVIKVSTSMLMDSDSLSSQSVFWRNNLMTEAQPRGCSDFLPIYFALVNVFSAFICFRCCATACKILAKVPCYTIPMVLATPITTLCLWFYFTKYKPSSGSDICLFPMPISKGNVDVDWRMIAAGIAGYMSILCITYHIWSSGQKRMLASKYIFSRTMFTGPLLDQSLLLNKLVEELPENESTNKKTENISPSTSTDPNQGKSHETTVIYMCATMWHESHSEMIQILLSILRMDFDQMNKKRNMTYIHKTSDYYEFEAHIFFDDAFTDTKDGRTINDYVRTLIDCVPEAARYFNKILELSEIRETPYGGRIEWTLPGNNRLVAHLKDPLKIRKKKRWSQVMYMYYFFAYKLTEIEDENARFKAAKNRYILALDGDVDFKPSAVQLLVDRMKKNENVGAACGRIHPIGAGPMVWYQKFEYAVSHWLQKAAEHVTGCVLCSPGCFSLFRASALMDDNVMKRYTAIPTEARHHIQYDQGEDRWLCTLLLQQGYRVEYCAASDALTYAPETFKEFFTQRRRWTPSTMANIIDLLLDWRHVTKRNMDISLVYIAYQVLLMVSSILTPGTIFLMIIGAISMAYPALSLYWSLLINGLPITVFVVVNMSSNNDNLKVTLAAIMSVVYALVMMLVVVGLLRQVFEYGICSVTTMFLCGVAGVFVISAFLHPQEFACLLHGFLYFLAIPSMSLILMLYALCNLDNVAWGTRETAPVKQENPAKATEKQVPTDGIFHNIMQKIGSLREEGTSDYAFSFGNLFRCMCCPRTTKDNTDLKFEAILTRLDAMEASRADIDHKGEVDEKKGVNDTPSTSDTNRVFEAPEIGKSKDNPLYNTFWMEDEKLMHCKSTNISAKEEIFWKWLIARYLTPYHMTDEKKQMDKEALTNLRNKVCLFFILMNALFVTIVFCLQQVNMESGGTISIPLPCGTGKSGESVEPISIAFTLVFGILLGIQFLCMISHRISTFLHICAMTTMTIEKNQLDISSEILKNHDDDDARSQVSRTTGGSSDERGRVIKRRDNILRKTVKGRNTRNYTSTYDEDFDDGIRKTPDKAIDKLPISEEAKEDLKRRKTIVQKRWKKAYKASRKPLKTGTQENGAKVKFGGFASVVGSTMALAQEQKGNQQPNDQTLYSTVNNKL